MSRSKISNPILRGFHPDPSICRVGDDYYIAVSTFEWYPGVQIYHSLDLENWRLVEEEQGVRSHHDVERGRRKCIGQSNPAAIEQVVAAPAGRNDYEWTFRHAQLARGELLIQNVEHAIAYCLRSLILDSAIACNRSILRRMLRTGSEQQVATIEVISRIDHVQAGQ